MLFYSISSCNEAKCTFNCWTTTLGITVKKSIGRFTSEFENPLDCILMRVQEEIWQNKSLGLIVGTCYIKICVVGL